MPGQAVGPRFLCKIQEKLYKDNHRGYVLGKFMDSIGHYLTYSEHAVEGILGNPWEIRTIPKKNDEWTHETKPFNLGSTLSNHSTLSLSTLDPVKDEMQVLPSIHWDPSCVFFHSSLFLWVKYAQDIMYNIYIYINGIWLLIKIPLSRNGHSSRIKKLLSRNFRELHVYLSRSPCWPTTPLMKIRSPPAKLRQRITDHFLVAF